MSTPPNNLRPGSQHSSRPRLNFLYNKDRLVPLTDEARKLENYRPPETTVMHRSQPLSTISRTTKPNEHVEKYGSLQKWIPDVRRPIEKSAVTSHFGSSSYSNEVPIRIDNTRQNGTLILNEPRSAVPVNTSTHVSSINMVPLSEVRLKQPEETSRTTRPTPRSYIVTSLHGSDSFPELQQKTVAISENERTTQNQVPVSQLGSSPARHRLDGVNGYRSTQDSTSAKINPMPVVYSPEPTKSIAITVVPEIQPRVPMIYNQVVTPKEIPAELVRSPPATVSNEAGKLGIYCLPETTMMQRSLQQSVLDFQRPGHESGIASHFGSSFPSNQVPTPMDNTRQNGTLILNESRYVNPVNISIHAPSISVAPVSEFLQKTPEETSRTTHQTPRSYIVTSRLGNGFSPELQHEAVTFSENEKKTRHQPPVSQLGTSSADRFWDRINSLRTTQDSSPTMGRRVRPVCSPEPVKSVTITVVPEIQPREPMAYNQVIRPKEIPTELVKSPPAPVSVDAHNSPTNTKMYITTVRSTPTLTKASSLDNRSMLTSPNASPTKSPLSVIASISLASNNTSPFNSQLKNVIPVSVKDPIHQEYIPGGHDVTQPQMQPEYVKFQKKATNPSSSRALDRARYYTLPHQVQEEKSASNAQNPVIHNIMFNNSNLPKSGQSRRNDPRRRTVPNCSSEPRLTRAKSFHEIEADDEIDVKDFKESLLRRMKSLKRRKRSPHRVVV